ncbi:unnamed protein product [Amoebophrya sp. A120]|nr:unnamed protein product [Amoebophrya sp. A120]|eukprot:GSA120T00001170001.1
MMTDVVADDVDDRQNKNMMNNMNRDNHEEATEKTRLLSSAGVHPGAVEETRKPVWLDKDKYITNNSTPRMEVDSHEQLLPASKQHLSTKQGLDLDGGAGAAGALYDDADAWGDHNTAFQKKLFAPYLVTSKWKIWCLSSCWVYYGMVLSTYVAFTIPLEAMRMAPGWQSSFVVLERMIYGLTHLTAPFFGKISDETRHPWGKRRPLLAGGVFLLLSSHTMLFFASDQLAMYLYLIALSGAMVAKNLVIACTSGYLADVVPKELSSTVSGITTIQCATGCLIGFGTQYLLASSAVKFTYVYVTGVYVLATLLFFLVASEPPSDAESLQRFRQEFEREERARAGNQQGMSAASLTPPTTAQQSSATDAATDTESVATSQLYSARDSADYYTHRQPRYLQNASLADRSTRAPSSRGGGRGPSGATQQGYSSDGQTSVTTDTDSDFYNNAEDIIDTHMRYTHYNSVAVGTAGSGTTSTPRPTTSGASPNNYVSNTISTSNNERNLELHSAEVENDDSSFFASCSAGLAAASGAMSSFFGTFWHALTISPDYQYLVFVRIFFYAGCSSMSMFLFYLRDALHVPTKAEGIQQLSSLAMISQCAIIVVALGATLLTSRVYAQKVLVGVGLGAMVLVFSTLCLLPMLTPEYASFHYGENNPAKSLILTETGVSILVHIGGFGYGLGVGFMGVGDMGLAFKLVPAGVGNGAAMSIFGPSITYGFVLGSIVIGTALQHFKVPGGSEDKHSEAEMAEAASRQQALDQAQAASGATAGAAPKADFNGVLWEPGYTEGGHQLIALCSVIMCGIAAALLYKVDTRRALARTANGEQE